MSHTFTDHYIDGAWVEAESDERIEVVDAATEQVIGSVPAGTAAEVERAVAAARAAFDGWSATAPEARAKVLTAVSEAILAREEELAQLQSREVGTPLTVSRAMHVRLPAATFGSQAGYVEGAFAAERIGNADVVREPIGVAGLITPWNFPLQQVAAKVAPALAAGCTVVLKPSEVAPLTAHLLVDMFEAAGLPAGVLNVVFGYGPAVGEAIVRHPDVDMVSFTGSTAVGRRISTLASETVKKVTLELGGKSPLVMLPDADSEVVARRSVTGSFVNNGQTCSALTRLVVPRSRQDEVERAVLAAVAAVQLGDPLATATTLGPVISDRQRDRVRGYIEQGTQEGARLLVGGAEAPDGLATGYYVRPTVFTDVTPQMTIAQEEIFGPVLVIQPYDDGAGDDDALRIANSTSYGLASAVMGADETRVNAVARRIRAGQVEINGADFNPFAPFGGYKQSGNGRELGRMAIEEYLQTKSVLR